MPNVNSSLREPKRQPFSREQCTSQILLLEKYPRCLILAEKVNSNNFTHCLLVVSALEHDPLYQNTVLFCLSSRNPHGKIQPLKNMVD